MINDKYLHKGDRDTECILLALAGLQLSGTSTFIDDFENALKNWFGTDHAVALSSGTAALQLSLNACNVRPGDEVVVPAIAPLPTVYPILTLGAKPVFVDVEADSISIDLEDLERKCSKNTKAIIALPLWGYPCDMRALTAFVDGTVPIIEDAAQAHGTMIQGRLAGKWGSIGCFSTHDRKILATGEGGFIITNNATISREIKRFSRLGDLDGKHYGVNFKMPTLCAALGVARLGDIDAQIDLRRAVAKKIAGESVDGQVVELRIPDESRINGYVLVLQVCDPEKRFRINKNLNDIGIASDYDKYGYDVSFKRPVLSEFVSDAPNAEKLLPTLIQVPVHPGLSGEDIQKIGDAIWS